MADASGDLQSCESMAVLVSGGPVPACVDGCDVSIGSHVRRLPRRIAQAIWFGSVLVLREAVSEPDLWNDNVVALDEHGVELWRAESAADWRYAPYVEIHSGGGLLFGVTSEGLACEIDLGNGSISGLQAMSA